MSYLISRICWVHALSRRLSVNRLLSTAAEGGLKRSCEVTRAQTVYKHRSPRRLSSNGSHRSSIAAPAADEQAKRVVACVVRRGLTSTLGEHVLAILALHGLIFISSSLPSPRQPSHTIFIVLNRPSQSLPRPECRDDRAACRHVVEALPSGSQQCKAKARPSIAETAIPRRPVRAQQKT